MGSLLARWKGAPERSVPSITTIDEYAELLNQFTFNGIGYGFGGLQQTLAGQTTEQAANTFVGLASAYAGNSVVFSCMLVRQLVFSSIRFRWQRLRDGKPSDTFGVPELSLLERPWMGGTTQDLLSRTIQDADLGGNAYWTRVQPGEPIGYKGSWSPTAPEMVRLRPDWVDLVLEPRLLPDRPGQLGYRKVGYLYTEGGPSSGADPVAFLPDEVVHYAPIPDPLASYRGMSWLTPILREIRADQAMTRHQQAFFDNGATPNMVIKHDVQANEEKVKRFAEMMQERHGGVRNAYKTLHLYPGADLTVVGSNLKDIDFKEVRGGGETRVAAAAGVPPVIVGLSEGLAAATYSNYGQARRRLADGTAHPLWQNVAGSFETIMPRPGRDGGLDVRLWYDASNVPFLREDEKDAAAIAQVMATTTRTYIDAGFEPASVIAALEANDRRLLVHSGLYSVQLQKPGASDAPATPPNQGGPDEGN